MSEPSLVRFLCLSVRMEIASFFALGTLLPRQYGPINGFSDRDYHIEAKMAFICPSLADAFGDYIYHTATTMTVCDGLLQPSIAHRV